MSSYLILRSWLESLHGITSPKRIRNRYLERANDYYTLAIAHLHIATWTEKSYFQNTISKEVCIEYVIGSITRFFLRKMPWISPILSCLLVHLPKSKPELVSFDLNNRNGVGDCQTFIGWFKSRILILSMVLYFVKEYRDLETCSYVLIWT